MSPMTAERRSEVIAEMRLKPGVMNRLWEAVSQMDTGYRYKVQTERNGRRRTIEGRFVSVEAVAGGFLTLEDEDGRLLRALVEDTILITVLPHD